MSEDMRDFTNTYHVEVFGDNGCWFDFVIAKTQKEAIEKVHKTYDEFHKNIKVKINDQYDYFIK